MTGQLLGQPLTLKTTTLKYNFSYLEYLLIFFVSTDQGFFFFL